MGLSLLHMLSTKIVTYYNIKSTLHICTKSVYNMDDCSSNPSELRDPSLVRLRLSPSSFTNWTALLNWTHNGSDSSPPILRKLVAQVIVYNVWKQRNDLIFNLQTIHPMTIFRDIDKHVKKLISARRHRKNFRGLMALWLD